jgi:hypothetical protein
MFYLICICVLSNMRENSCCSIFWFLIHYYQCLSCLACPHVQSPCTLLRRPTPQNACHGLLYSVLTQCSEMKIFLIFSLPFSTHLLSSLIITKKILALNCFRTLYFKTNMLPLRPKFTFHIFSGHLPLKIN